jgi:adenylate cyclase
MPDDPNPVEQLDLPELVDRVEQRLLGGERKYTRADVAERTNLAPDKARELWRALGFATVDDDERAFTDGDVAALRHVGELTDAMSLDDELLRAMTRMLGRSYSRLASWQGQLVVEQLSKAPELLTSTDELLDYLDSTLDTMQEIQDYVWRRQLAAYFSRVAPNAGSTSATGAATTMTVGFADMAQFTAFTRRSSEAELRAVLEEFETLATDTVAAHRGQIVKTIGDEVLFVTDTPVDGAETALGLLEGADRSDLLPPLRVGLASGEVVLRLGDVFGQTVNIASRLTSLARPDSVLVDEGLHEALQDDARYRFSALRPASVRGYQHLRSWRLRHRQAA